MNTTELFTTAGYELDEIGMFDFEGYTIDTEDVDLTENTIEDFIEARDGYAEHGTAKMFRPRSGCGAAIILDGVQVNKGDRRKVVIVFDLGSARAVAIY